MRIVDQHKIYSVEFDDVVVVRNENVIMAESMYKDASWKLGQYATNERAIEVLQLLHRAYSIDTVNILRTVNDFDCNEMSKELCMNEILLENVMTESIYPSIESRNAVFYMPKK